MREGAGKAALAMIICLLALGSGCGQTTTPMTKGGWLEKNETWSGEIVVTEMVIVPPEITLTVAPGTTVRFKPKRGYKKETSPMAGIAVPGGTLLAVGTPDRQIVFTSDTEDPINGDWSGIELSDTKSSKIDYAIVEFAILGIIQFDSEVSVSHSIIRWSNTEGLYAERSTPSFTYNTLYDNGYHEVALEQYNTNVEIKNNIFKGHRSAIHLEDTTVNIEDNYFENYGVECISAPAKSGITIKNNLFNGIPYDAIMVSEDISSIKANNQFGDNIPVPDPGYSDIKSHELGYIPGDPEDRYMYVFDAEDETRRVVSRMGKGLGFGWALTYAQGYLWRFTFMGPSIGSSADFIRMDPVTKEIKRYRNDTEIGNARGLAWDGEYFFVNEFGRLKIYKFKIEEDAIHVFDSFDVPEKEKGGTNGLATDGTYLYYHSRDGSRLFKLDKSGNILETTTWGDAALEGPFVWTGQNFLATGGIGIRKWTMDRQIVGEIYPPAVGTWSLAWDGKYIWTLQRTCEAWDDDKVFQIEVLDDSLKN